MLNQKGLRLISEETDSIVSFASVFIFSFECSINLNWILFAHNHTGYFIFPK